MAAIRGGRIKPHRRSSILRAELAESRKFHRANFRRLALPLHPPAKRGSISWPGIDGKRFRNVVFYSQSATTPGLGGSRWPRFKVNCSLPRPSLTRSFFFFLFWIRLDELGEFDQWSCFSFPEEYIKNLGNSKYIRASFVIVVLRN